MKTTTEGGTVMNSEDSDGTERPDPGKFAWGPGDVVVVQQPKPSSDEDAGVPWTATRTAGAVTQRVRWKDGLAGYEPENVFDYLLTGAASKPTVQVDGRQVAVNLDNGPAVEAWLKSEGWKVAR
jgi:hypothetical protein